MRKLLCILFAAALGISGARAQVRTYNDNTTNTFIFGLENYYYGVSGQMDFQAGGKTFQAVVSGSQVLLDGSVLDSGSGDTVIGIHDFTGDREPDLVAARRDGDMLSVVVYRYSSGEWTVAGRLNAPGKEIRVFRQVVSIRDGEVLRSWTWHGNRFDFKASDGSADPSTR